MIPQEQGPSLFGRLPDGQAVEAVRIGRGALRAEILTYGAVVRDLRFDGHGRPLVLGLNSMEDYLAHSRNFGASPGRCANRIADGRFVLDGRAYELERNEPGGVNHIHGGSAGMGRSPWTIRALTPDHVELWIRDPAGNAGFPGTVETTCTIRVSEAGVLAIRYESRSDAPCPVNLCHHGYFNLGRGPDIRDHTVRIAADAYLPVDDGKIPSARRRPSPAHPSTCARIPCLASGSRNWTAGSTTISAFRPIACLCAPSLGSPLPLACGWRSRRLNRACSSSPPQCFDALFRVWKERFMGRPPDYAWKRRSGRTPSTGPGSRMRC